MELKWLLLTVQLRCVRACVSERVGVLGWVVWMCAVSVYSVSMCIHAYMHTLWWCILHNAWVNISYDFLYLHSVQGYAADSDNDGASIPCFELFLRLMKEEKWVPTKWGPFCLVAALILVVCISWLFQVQGSTVWWYFCRVCIQEGATADSTAAGNSEETAATNSSLSITVVSL